MKGVLAWLVLTEQCILLEEGGYVAGGLRSEFELRARCGLRVSGVRMNSGIHECLEMLVVTIG